MKDNIDLIFQISQDSGVLIAFFYFDICSKNCPNSIYFYQFYNYLLFLSGPDSNSQDFKHILPHEIGIYFYSSHQILYWLTHHIKLFQRLADQTLSTKSFWHDYPKDNSINYSQKIKSNTQIKYINNRHNTISQNLYMDTLNLRNYQYAKDYVSNGVEAVSQRICQWISACYDIWESQISPRLQKWTEIGLQMYCDFCDYLSIKPFYMTLGITSLCILYLSFRFSLYKRNIDQYASHKKFSDDINFDEEQKSTATNNLKSEDSLLSLKGHMNTILQADREEEDDAEEIKQDRIFFQVFQNYRETLDYPFYE